MKIQKKVTEFLYQFDEITIEELGNSTLK